MYTSTSRKAGRIVGRALGIVFQFIFYSKAVEIANPRVVYLAKVGVKYGIKIANYTSKKYARRDFKDETIFSDSIDAISSAF